MQGALANAAPTVPNGHDIFAMNMPWVESPFFYQMLEQRDLTAEEREQAIFFHEYGFLRLSQVVSEPLISQVISEVDGLYVDDGRDAHRSHYRCLDAWRESAVVRQVAVNDRVLSTLRFLYGREPIPFQTLNFKYGSQQRTHSDTIHFSSIPARFMCGVWVALEDVDAENGPLFYYPGSQKLPEYDAYDLGMSLETFDYLKYEDFMERLMEAQNQKRAELHIKKGDALIWASNLAHGGSAIRHKGRTRHTQVSHYFFEDCIYYTPLASNIVSGELYLRTQLTNLRNNEPVPLSYSGRKVEVLPASGNRAFPVFQKVPELSRELQLAGLEIERRLGSVVGRLPSPVRRALRKQLERFRSRTS